MKILFVISSLSSGGAERVMSILANEFAKSNEVTIVTLSKSESFYNLDRSIKHIKLDLLKSSNNILETIINSLNRLRVLVKVFKRENPDVVISFMTHTNILATIAAKISNKKIIISERIAYDYYGSKILNTFRKFIYPLSDAFITQTQADLKNYIFLKNSYVIYNPIEIKNFDTNIKKENIVLGVGRLDKQKGFDLLIRAFCKIKDSNWKLVIAGEGDERDRLERLIKELKATNIELIGRTKEIFKWYKKASIFALSSNKEGFPNVLIEAMTFGCAVVSFDCPYGPGEIIQNGVNGLLIENQNEESLKEAIELLIKDKELREKLSLEAIKAKERYSIEKIANEWHRVIEGVVK